jgi:hypothetical protein
MLDDGKKKKRAGWNLGLTLKKQRRSKWSSFCHLIDQKLLRVPQSLLACEPSRTRFTMSSFISDLMTSSA